MKELKATTCCPHGISPDQQCMNCGPVEATPVETASPMQRCEKWLQKIAEKNPAGISDQYVNAFREGYQFAFNDAQLELTQVREELAHMTAAVNQRTLEADRWSRRFVEVREELRHAHAEIAGARNEAATCDDIVLNQSLAGVIGSLQKDRERLQIELGKAEAENKMRNSSAIFAGNIVGDSMNADWGGFDGLDIEEAAIKAGLLEQVKMIEPCGENCECASLGDFPTKCNRLTEAGKYAIEAALHSSTSTPEESK